MTINPAAPKPRFPRVPKKISLEEILPAVKTIAARKHRSYEFPGLDLKPGKKYLLVCDSTNDKLMLEALTQVVREGGGLLETIVLPGNPGMTDAVDLLDNQFSKNWLPGWVWQAIGDATTVIMNAFILLAYTPNVPVDLKGKTTVMWYLTPDPCLPQFFNFPVDLAELIDVKNWELLVNAKKMELTDLEGTDLRWPVARPNWDEFVARNRESFGTDYYPGHQMVPIPGRGAEGKLASSAITFGGPVSRATMTIQGTQVTRVDGEGKFPDVLRQTFDQYKDLKSPRLPGPGINFWTTLAIGTAPKCRLAANWEETSGSGRMHAWGGSHSRSGVIHTSVGEGIINPVRRIIRHMDLFFPTLIADGRTVIDKGHLTVLDDPEVIRLASRYGDPEALLREDWIPAIAGVNA